MQGSRLYERIVKDRNGCWIWQGAVSSSGYGHANVDGRTVAVHRLSWELANSKAVPNGLRVLHACDVKRCINPDHLSVGTSAQNSREMVDRGRYRGPRTLTRSDRDAILNELKSGRSQRQIAVEYGVSQATISGVKRGKYDHCWSNE